MAHLQSLMSSPEPHECSGCKEKHAEPIPNSPSIFMCTKVGLYPLQIQFKESWDHLVGCAPALYNAHACIYLCSHIPLQIGAMCFKLTLTSQ